MRLQFDIKELEEVKQLISRYPDRAAQISIMAINRTLQGVRTDVVKEITGKYNIKNKDVRSVMGLVKAKRKDTQGIVSIASKSLGIEQFKVRPSRIGTRKPKIGISAEVIKGRRVIREGTFFAPVGGKLRVFRREGKARLPIQRQWGGNVMYMLDDEQKQNIMISAKERLVKQYKQLIETGYKHVKDFKKR